MDIQTARRLIEAFPLPSLLVDADERILLANAAARTLFGDGIVDRHFITVLRQPATLDAVESCLANKDMAQGRYVGTDGTRDVTFRVKCAFVETDTGPGALVSFEDVTHKDEAGQMRRDFVANVSHELRTPLTALMGFIETLRGPARDDATARERFLSIMGDEAGRMNRLVADLLSLSRVEADERVRPTEEVDIAALASSVANTLEPMALDAGATLHVDIPDRPVIIPGDADQLRQVMSNLVENAVKYGGEAPEVTLLLEECDHAPALRGPAVNLTIRDKGPGIDPLHLPRLTERFYRVDSHRSREMGGTGLGLAIVKHIVNRHRGRLQITSEPGEGSQFTVILPSEGPPSALT